MRGDLQLQMLKSQGDRATLKVDAEGEAERRKIQAVTDAEIANMQIDLDARRVERMGDAAAHARQVQGYNWADEQQADVAKPTQPPVRRKTILPAFWRRLPWQWPSVICCGTISSL